MNRKKALFIYIPLSQNFQKVEAEAPVLWLPDANNSLFGKDPDAGKD